LNIMKIISRQSKNITCDAIKSFVTSKNKDNYPTSMNEHIHVHVEEVDGEDTVLLMEYEDCK